MCKIVQFITCKYIIIIIIIIIILRCNRYTPIALMLNVLNLMTARQTIMYNTLLTIFKIKNKIVPQYLYSKIKFISERQNYNLRNCKDFDIKFSRYDIKYKSTVELG
jgi:hypothetical protein